MPLTKQQRQGLHGEGFVFALASAAGLIAGRQILDVDGIDWEIGYPGPYGTTRSPKIDLQVKTWSDPRADGSVWRYEMRAKHFNALAGPGFTVPRYLVLVTVPSAPDQYVACRPTEMRLRQAAYWTSLADRSPVPVTLPLRKIRVDIPVRNLLTPQSLIALVTGQRTGGPS